MSWDDGFWWERAEAGRAAYDADRAGESHGGGCTCLECWAERAENEA